MTRSRHMRVTVLGTRGSAPVSGDGFAVFGGNTSCYLVEAGDETIILDAGSGLMNAPCAFARTPHILLSHLHLDHVLGLGMYGRLSQPGAVTRLYVPSCGSRVDARKVIDLLYSPPLWPLGLADYGGSLQVDTLPKVLGIGEVTVETERGNHPGGCRLIRIGFAGRVLVYATDFEHGAEASARLAAFAHNADLLLYDGQYDEGEYAAHRGFGHSTADAGVALMERAGVRQLLIVHHGPQSTDSALLARERSFGRPNVRFARQGEVIEL